MIHHCLLKRILLVGLMLSGLILSAANAAVLTENFDDPFTDWRSGFMGVHTNLESYYVESGDPNQLDRGNNPNGIWIADGDGIASDTSVSILFDAPFGSTISSISFAVGAYTGGSMLEIFDVGGATLLLAALVINSTVAPTDFYSTISGNGIGGFRIFANSQIEGNTNIDSITLMTNPIPTVPVPAAIWLFGTAIMGMVGFNRRKTKLVATA